MQLDNMDEARSGKKASPSTSRTARTPQKSNEVVRRGSSGKKGFAFKAEKEVGVRVGKISQKFASLVDALYSTTM